MTKTPEEFAQTPEHGTPLALAPDALSPVLELARLSGGTVYRSAPPAPFTLHDAGGSAAMLLVEDGALRLTLDGTEEWRLLRGDFALLPHGHPHRLADRDGRWSAAPTPAAWHPATRVIGGGGGDRWLTARFTVDPILAKHLLTLLPPVLVIRSADGRVADWLAGAAHAMMQEALQAAPGAQVIVNRTIELIFAHAMRQWAANSDSATGWLGAALDPRIGRAITAIHTAPERPWSVDELARLAGMSRSNFAERFQQLVGYTPAAYVACWRLDRATVLLRASDLSVASVASRSGYQSAAAFSRAFRGYFGVSPQVWRQQLGNGAGAPA